MLNFNNRIKLQLLFSFILIAISMDSLSAQKIPGRQLFQIGVQEFNKGEYENAVYYFESARGKGVQTNSLYYNLGVSYFKTKQYDLAKKAFREIVDSEGLSALAHYNLGLVALQKDNLSEATKHFETVFKTAKDQKLKLLAQRQLAKKKRIPDKQKVAGFFSFAAGYDDNVNLDSEAEIQDDSVSDSFYEMSAGINHQPLNTQDKRLQLGLSGYLAKYSEHNENDFSSVKVYTAYIDKIGAWKTKTTADASMLYLDSKPFERILGLSLAGSYKIKSQFALVLSFKLDSIEAYEKYEYLSGSRQKFKAKIRSKLSGMYGDLGFEFEKNDRNDTSYPNRNQIFTSLKKNLSTKWKGKVAISYRVSEYQEISRKDNRFRLKLKASRQVHAKWNLYGKYTYTKNDSSSKNSSYVNNLTSIGTEGTF